MDAYYCFEIFLTEMEYRLTVGKLYNIQHQIISNYMQETNYTYK